MFKKWVIDKSLMGPAAYNHEEEVIKLNPLYLRRYNAPQIRFIIAHEFGHAKYKTASERLADEYAFKIAGTKSAKEGVKILNYDFISFDQRKQDIKNLINENMEKLATPFIEESNLFGYGAARRQHKQEIGRKAWRAEKRAAGGGGAIRKQYRQIDKLNKARINADTREQKELIRMGYNEEDIITDENGHVVSVNGQSLPSPISEMSLAEAATENSNKTYMIAGVAVAILSIMVFFYFKFIKK
jgi:hypothetical protein